MTAPATCGGAEHPPVGCGAPLAEAEGHRVYESHHPDAPWVLVCDLCAASNTEAANYDQYARWHINDALRGVAERGER